MLIKNKKGDLPVVLLVFLVLLVVLTSLFIFATRSQTIIATISDVGIVNQANMKKNSLEFHIFQILENSIVESYKEMIQDGQLVENPSFDTNLYVRFNSLSLTLNEDFSKEFAERFKKRFENYDAQNSELLFQEIKKLVEEEKFVYFFNGKKIKISFSETGNLKIQKLSEKINVSYSPHISLSTTFGKIGLNDFEEIYSAKEICKIIEESTEEKTIKECFEKELEHFNVEILEKKKTDGETYFVIILTSKKIFLINEKPERINFGFIPI